MNIIIHFQKFDNGLNMFMQLSSLLQNNLNISIYSIFRWFSHLWREMLTILLLEHLLIRWRILSNC